MSMPKVVCYALLEQVEPVSDRGHFWPFKLQRIPIIGGTIKGEEVDVPGTGWECRLVIKDPNQVDLVDAFYAMDKVADHGNGFVERFRDLLVALMSGKRKI